MVVDQSSGRHQQEGEPGHADDPAHGAAVFAWTVDDEAALRRVLDAGVDGVITNEVAREALELLEVDDRGLERIDRELLSTILLKFGGGPVGLSTLAVALGEEQDTIEDVYEPFLLQLGFLQRTPRGRIITELGREQLGAPPAADGTKLF